PPTQPAETAVRAHGDHIKDCGRKVPVYVGSLRHVCDAMHDLAHRRPKHPDVAAEPWNEAKRGLCQRGFASAVGADDGAHAAGGHTVVDREEGGGAAVAYREATDVECRRGTASLRRGYASQTMRQGHHGCPPNA